MMIFSRDTMKYKYYNEIQGGDSVSNLDYPKLYDEDTEDSDDEGY